MDKEVEDYIKEKELKAPKDKFVFKDGTDISLKQASHHFKAKIAAKENLKKKERKLAEIAYHKYRVYLGQKGKHTKVARGTIRAKLLKLEKEIVELFGRMFTVREVQEILLDVYSTDIDYNSLNKFRLKNVETIAPLVEKHQQTHSELRLSHKKSRLEEYTELYATLKEQFMKKPNAQTLNSLKSVLEAIRIEVDGDLVINGALEVNLQGQIASHFKNEVYKSANIQEMIISKVAAKGGVHPLMLMYSIENSYYAEINKLNAEDIDWEEELYPSEQQYDYDHIEEQHKEKIKERAESVNKHLKNTEVTADMAKEFKKKLLEKLSEGKQVVKSKKDILKAIQKVKQQKALEEGE